MKQEKIVITDWGGVIENHSEEQYVFHYVLKRVIDQFSTKPIPSNYQEILKIFCDYGAEKKREIQNLYEKHDWKGYAIEVHALKSTSLGIGAVRLSELAKRLELAAKEEKEEMIFAEHDAAMEEYRMVLEEIEKDLE